MTPSWKETISKKYNSIFEHLKILEYVILKEILYLWK